MSKLGTLYIIAAPSGAGKTSLVRAILSQVDGIEISVSYTTRAARSNDIEGVDYYFLEESEFMTKVANQDFLEHADVFGYQYGTCKDWVLQKIRQGIDIILEIDWQGARQIRQLFPKSVSIFIFPPSLPTLQQRLITRNQDSEETIACRMLEAEAEMSHYHEFDYLVINDDFELALKDLRYIIAARRLRTPFQLDTATNILEQFVKKG